MGLNLPFHIWPLKCDRKVIPSQHVTCPWAFFSGEPTSGQHIFRKLTLAMTFHPLQGQKVTANTSLGLSSGKVICPSHRAVGGRARLEWSESLLFPGQGVGPQGDLGSKSWIRMSEPQPKGWPVPGASLCTKPHLRC